jgi:rare lipoprotein A
MRHSLRFLLLVSLGAATGLGSCHRSSEAEKRGPEQTVSATWYNVPPESLARRRAGREELTAASDKLKLGTLVKVTRVTNGKSVVVRITDYGLHSRKSRLDLCKEAAEQLDMVSDGIAKVELRVLNDE